MIGVNLSGAEFGKIGGAYGTAYIYPSSSDIKYYTDRGVELFRLPVRWERLQPVAGGALDKAELSRLVKFLNDADALGAKVIIDLHNYGAYFGNKIGSPEVSGQQFADFWKSLAGAVGNIRSVYGYDLMNEPNNMGSADVWPKAAQQAVDAIRTVDHNTSIYVEGNAWAGAKNWTANNAALNINDPANKIVYEAHLYFDKYSSGTYKGTYDQEGATPDMGANLIKDFTNWLAQRGAKGMIGEFAVPDNDPRWLTVLDKFLAATNAAGLDATYWGAGPWWGDYPLALRNKDGTESVQLDVLENYVAAAAAAATGAKTASVLSASASAVPTATDGADVLLGTSQADTLSGLKGNDFFEGRGGADRIDGGQGIDTASYADSTVGVRIDLTASIQHGGSAEGDVLLSVENINGSGFDDVIKGDAAANALSGMAGNDLFLVGSGNDTLDGGTGTDTVDFTGASQVVANLQTGLATMKGGTLTLLNIENLTGSGNADVLIGNGLANVLTGGAGDDTLDGGGGADRMVGGLGNDTYTVDNLGDTVVEDATGGKSDTVKAWIDGYTLGANVENLTLLGSGDLSGYGNELYNSLVGNDGANTLSGFGGSDKLFGNGGNDILLGGDGYDTLSGGSGSDDLYGGTGNDQLSGDAGADRLWGGDGDDTLIGGAGGDILNGGAGRDVFKFALADSTTSDPDTIQDFTPGADRIDLSAIDANAKLANDQAFSFVGKSAFSHVAGELRYEQLVDQAGHTYTDVQGDVNGDGIADFSIHLANLTSTLSGSNFIL